MPDIFGLPGIFDNVRDGLVLVRLPQGEIVLFNRAATDLCGLSSSEAMGTDFAGIFTDKLVQSRTRRSGSQAVGEWPGHDQEEFRTTIRTNAGDRRVDLHVCRVEDVGAGGPLVLLVLRPVVDGAETVLAATIRKVSRAQAVEAA